MISILIPCYNFNAYPLVSKLEKQALILNINFEIICIDDGSFSAKNEINQKINLLTNSRFIESKKNLGRINNKLLLAKSSQYDWLIFIDVDTYPSNDSFLKNYVNQIDKSAFNFGGCIYNKPENTNLSLRYKFGKNREEISSEKRNKNPYKYISSSNFMCKKDLIIEVFSKIKNVSYGNDYVFGSILKKNNIDILHTNNPVDIKNIDENSIFIKKTHQALANILSSYKRGEIQKHSISILKAYRILDSLFMKKIFINLTNKFIGKLEKNLHKENPNLFLFDLYRLNYMCQTDLLFPQIK